jgi:hypothetical protein
VIADMNSYLITIICTDKVFSLVVKSVSKRQANLAAEPYVQHELTSRIIRRKIAQLA